MVHIVKPNTEFDYPDFIKQIQLEVNKVNQIYQILGLPFQNILRFQLEYFLPDKYKYSLDFSDNIGNVTLSPQLVIKETDRNQQMERNLVFVKIQVSQNDNIDDQINQILLAISKDNPNRFEYGVLVCVDREEGNVLKHIKRYAMEHDIKGGPFIILIEPNRGIQQIQIVNKNLQLRNPI